MDREHLQIHGAAVNLTQRFLDIVGRIMPDNGRDEISELYELLDDAIGVTDSVMSLLGRETPECHGYSEIDAGIRQLDPQVMSTRANVTVLASTFSKRT